MSEIDGPFAVVEEYGDELMEFALGSCLRVLGPRARAACTPVLVEFEEGERRFVVDEIGLGVIRVEALNVDGRTDEGKERNLFCTGVEILRERGKGREGTTGRSWLKEKKKERNGGTPSHSQVTRTQCSVVFQSTWLRITTLNVSPAQLSNHSQYPGPTLFHFTHNLFNPR